MKRLITGLFVAFAAAGGAAASVTVPVEGFAVGVAPRYEAGYCSFVGGTLVHDPDAAGSLTSREWSLDITPSYGCTLQPDDLLLPLTVSSCWRREGETYAIRYGAMSSPSYCQLLRLSDAGEILSVTDMDTSHTVYKCVYREDEDMLYSWVSWANEIAFASSSPDDPSVFTPLARFSMTVAERPSALAYRPDDGNFYYIDNSSRFWRISPAGVRTFLYDTGIANFQGDTSSVRDNRGGSGLMWSSDLGVFLWSYPRVDAGDGMISALPPEADSGEGVREVWRFNGDMFISSFLPSFGATGQVAPASPQIASVDFTPGDFTADVTFTLPTAYVDGTPVKGELGWKASIDGKVCEEGRATPGSKIKVTYDTPVGGYHVLSLVAVDGVMQSDPAEVTRFFGFGTPLPVQWVRLEQAAGGDLSRFEASWAQAEETVEGAPVNSAQLRYDLYLDGELMISGETDTRCDVHIPSGDKDATHVFGVQARTPEGGSDITFAPPVTVADVPGIEIETGVCVSGGVLTISGHSGDLIGIRLINGCRVLSHRIESDIWSCPLDRGVYLVTIDGRTFKIMI